MSPQAEGRSDQLRRRKSTEVNEVRREEVELTWQGGLRFEARAGEHRLILDSEHQAGPSPTQALAASLAGCMAIDVADILQKGRLPLEGLEVRLVSERRGEPPRYVTRWPSTSW